MEDERVLREVTGCSSCGGTGWLINREDPRALASPCPQCRSRARTTSILEGAGIPPRYLERGFDVYSVHHPLQEKALKKSIDFVDRFPRVERGLLFVGPCGVGKTHLSVAILRALIEEKQIPARFVDETELLRRLQYSYHPNSPETEREVMAPLMETDLIVWDDLGTGRPTEWVKETMRTVINYRYTYNKHTIFTTNRLMAQSVRGGAPEPVSAFGGGHSAEGKTLVERIGPHLHSRIMEMCEIVEVQGPDARTEIHKAGFDFQRSPSASKKPEAQGQQAVDLPSGLLKCPRCETPKVLQQDSSSVRGSRWDRHVEIACLCEKCGDRFLARFFTQSARIEYVEH